MPTYKLTYFDLPGAAEHIRYIFAYAGQEFEDVRVKFEDWPALKPKTPYGKLPLLEIDGRVFTQSNAIARYLARKFDLNFKDEWEELQADVLVDTLGDLRQSIYKSFFEKDEKRKEELTKELMEETFPFYLQKFNETVNSDGLLVDSEVTWADLTFASTLSNFEDYHPGILKNYAALERFVEKINNIPTIKAYLETRPVTKPPQH